MEAPVVVGARRRVELGCRKLSAEGRRKVEEALTSLMCRLWRAGAGNSDYSQGIYIWDETFQKGTLISNRWSLILGSILKSAKPTTDVCRRFGSKSYVVKRRRKKI